MARVHRIKSWPPSFDAIVEGTKTNDVRVFDRDYRVGDYVELLCFDSTNNVFMGGSAYRKVTFIEEILSNRGVGCEKFAVLSYAPLAPSDEDVDGKIEIVEAPTEKKVPLHKLSVAAAIRQPPTAQDPPTDFAEP